MSRNNLVPVVRPDINGKLVTRHVLPEAAAQSAASIPAPSVRVPSGPRSSEEFKEAIADLIAPHYEATDISTSDDFEWVSALLKHDFDELSYGALMAYHRVLQTATDQEKALLANGMQELSNVVIDQFLEDDDKERVFFGALESLDLCSAFRSENMSPSAVLSKCYVAARQSARYLNVESRSWKKGYDRDRFRYLVFRELAKEHGRISNQEIDEDVEWFKRNEQTLMENVHLLEAHTTNGIVNREWVDELTASPARGLNEGIL